MRMPLLLLTLFAVSVSYGITLNAEETYTYVSDIKPIIDSKCLVCHQNWAPSYDTLTAYPNLVIPGDPDNSLIIWRIEGKEADGGSITQMPLGGPYLDDDTITMFRVWIAEGAIKDVTTGVEESAPWSDIKRLFE